MTGTQATPLPGGKLETEKLPGHWLLARMGKRVLRPGGRELTGRMIEALAIGPADDVVEFAPGLGETARLTIAKRPASYTAIERDKDAAAMVQTVLQGPEQRCVVGAVEETGLPDASASVVYGEAMLSMQTADRKARIVREAHRLLKPGGRYGIHELCLVPDDLPETAREEIRNGLSEAVHHAARPLTSSEWRGVLEAAGFSVQTETQAPMRLLSPGRLLRDEGVFGALRFAFHVLSNPEARHRARAMRGAFSRYREQIAAVVFVARKNERNAP